MASARRTQKQKNNQQHNTSSIIRAQRASHWLLWLLLASFFAHFAGYCSPIFRRANFFWRWFFFFVRLFHFLCFVIRKLYRFFFVCVFVWCARGPRMITPFFLCWTTEECWIYFPFLVFVLFSSLSLSTKTHFAWFHSLFEWQSAFKYWCWCWCCVCCL